MTNFIGIHQSPVFKWPLFLMVFILLGGCQGRLGKCYLEKEVLPKPSVTEVIDDDSVQIHYFFDKTASMMGFARKSDSAYTYAIPVLYEAGENLWPITEQSYYVYGDSQIGKIKKDKIHPRETGLRSSSFYRLRDIDDLFGTRIKYSDGKPFSAVHDYIKSTIDADSKCLYVVVTDFYETDSNNVFYRFFRDAFAANLSGAIFAVESEFNGDVYDIYPDKRKAFTTKGQKISTFFILIIGSSSEVIKYSEKLYSDFISNKIIFDNTVFIIGSNERVSPVTFGSVTTDNPRKFNTEKTKLSLVNLRRYSDNRKLGIYQWDNHNNSAAANADAYQMFAKIGIRYAGKLTDKAILSNGNFDYPVIPKIEYTAGSNSGKESETPTKFKEDKKNYDFFNFRTEVMSKKTRISHPLFMIIDTRNYKSIKSGYYKITYSVQANAVLPDWVKNKDAVNIDEYTEAHNNNERMKVLGLGKVYNDIAEAYNKTKTRAAWSGELFLIKRK